MEELQKYVEYYPKFFEQEKKYFDRILEEVKDILSETAIKYVSKGRKSAIIDLHQEKEFKSIQEIRTIIELNTGKIFDYVLVHLYQNGDASISWHNDKEAMNSTICSVSFGQARKFRLKQFNKKTGYDQQYILGDSDMIIMLPGCQRKYLHCVPKEKGAKNCRINLTFRQYEF